MKFKNYNIYPSLINDKKTLQEAINDFGCNICKGSKKLRNDKNLILQAIEKDPTTALYLPEELKDDYDIKAAIERKDEELLEFVDPLEELKRKKSPDELNLLVQARNKILFNYLNQPQTDNQFSSNDRDYQRVNSRDDDFVIGG